MQVRRRRQFQRRMPLFFQFDSADRPRRQALRHQLELVPVLDVARHRGGIQLAFDPKEISIWLRKMFRRKICREQSAHVFERQLQEARSNRASEERTDLVRQFAEAQKLVIMPVGRAFEFVPVRMERRQFSQQFPQLDIKLKGRNHGRLN